MVLAAIPLSCVDPVCVMAGMAWTGLRYPPAREADPSVRLMAVNTTTAREALFSNPPDDAVQLETLPDPLVESLVELLHLQHPGVEGVGGLWSNGLYYGRHDAVSEDVAGQKVDQPSQEAGHGRQKDKIETGPVGERKDKQE
jgi:hypothetical protein